MTTRIAFNDFTRYDHSADVTAIQRVLRSGWLILGNEVRQFEHEWADRCGVNHAVGVGNGLDAIEIGMRSLGIGAGDEVITTPMTAVATVLGIIRAGATPVMADIDPTTALLDPRSVLRCISTKTRAVLIVHLYGQIRSMETWQQLCSSYGLLLIEDCAQAHDATSHGQVAGTFGAFGAYSFYPTKNLGAAGDAGAIITNDLELSNRSRTLRNYGQVNRYEHPLTGLNSRLDEMQAAILRGRLPQLSTWTARRREIAEMYRDLLANPAITLMAPPASPTEHVHHLFVVLTEQRDELQLYLESRGIESLIHYPIPAHLQRSLKLLPCDPNGLTAAEAHAAKCLSLPCAPHLSDSDVATVVDAVNSFGR